MGNNGNNLRRFDQYRIDLDRKILWINDSPAELPTKAVELLCVLIENEGSVISKGELLDRVWQDSFVEEGVLPQNVYLLRKIFKLHGTSENLIQTVARRGYRFVCDRLEPANGNRITIEHEVFEQKLIAETEYSTDGDASLVHDPRFAYNDDRSKTISADRRAGAVYFLAVGVLVVGLIGFFALYPRFSGGNSDPVRQTGATEVQYDRLTASGRALYVGLSPNDENAAYVINTADGKFSLLLYHLPTKSETVIVEPQESHLFSIQFSPDGNYIYYGAAKGIERAGIYRIPILGGTGQLITTAPVNYFSISPDGEWMAFYKRVPEEPAHHLTICRAIDGGGCRTVTKRANGPGFKIWGTSPAWYPDGSKLLAAAFTPVGPGKRARQHLLEIDLETGEQKDIAAPEWAGVHQAYWTSDGTGIYTMVREKFGDPVQLWYLDYPSGNARRITNDNNDYRQFRRSSDSAFLLAAMWSKAENLFLVPAGDPSNARQLTHDIAGNNGAWSLKWTVDGNGLVYSRSDGYLVGNLWKLDLDSMAVTQLTFDKHARPDTVEVTADGASAIFASNRTGTFQIWQVGLDGTGLKQLGENSAKGEPEISPDGRWLYYNGDGRWKMPVEVGEPIRVINETLGVTRISPADPATFAAFYFDNEEKEISPWKLGIFREGNERPVTSLDIKAINFDWKADGSGLYIVDDGESFSNIWFAPIDGGKPVRITNFKDQKISNLSLSPDGKTFAVSRGAAIGNIIRIGIQN